MRILLPGPVVLLGSVLSATAAAPLFAQDTPSAMARATLTPTGNVVVGQPVTIGVEVLVPTFFRGAPQYASLELPGAIAFFNERGTNFTERRDGGTWAGQRRSYTVYPNRVGAHDAGPIPVEVSYGVGSRVVVDTVFAPAVRFEAVIPEEARGLRVFVAAEGLRVDQDVEPASDTIRVGEAFTRTVTTEVDGTLSMVVPPLAFDSIDGLAVYPSPPRLEDTGGERGSAVLGQRVESASYVATEEGDYALPPVAVDWWDWSRGTLRRAEVPGVTFTVVANPDLATEIELPPDSLDVEEEEASAPATGVDDRLRRWATWLAGALVIFWVAYRLLAPRLPALTERVRASRLAHADSEAAHFRHLLEATRSGNPQATANALAAWLEKLHAAGGPRTARALAAAVDDVRLSEELSILDDVLYGSASTDQDTWSGGTLEARLTDARKRLMTQGKQEHLPRPGQLHPLNPTAS